MLFICVCTKSILPRLLWLFPEQSCLFPEALRGDGLPLGATAAKSSALAWSTITLWQSGMGRPQPVQISYENRMIRGGAEVMKVGAAATFLNVHAPALFKSFRLTPPCGMTTRHGSSSSSPTNALPPIQADF